MPHARFTVSIAMSSGRGTIVLVCGPLMDTRCAALCMGGSIHL